MDRFRRSNRVESAREGAGFIEELGEHTCTSFHSNSRVSRVADANLIPEVLGELVVEVQRCTCDRFVEPGWLAFDSREAVHCFNAAAAGWLLSRDYGGTIRVSAHRRSLRFMHILTSLPVCGVI